MANLVTPAQLAERFQISVDALHRWRQTFGWPHVEFGPRTIRFTEEQVEEIVRQHTVDGKFTLPWERTGQTYLSWQRGQTTGQRRRAR